MIITLFFLWSFQCCSFCWIITVSTLVAQKLHSLFEHVPLCDISFFPLCLPLFLTHRPPTNFGLAASWRARMEQQRAVVPTLSEYRASYPLHPISTFCYSHHISMPKRFSSSQLPANLSNEDLALKHKPRRQVSSNPTSLLWTLPHLQPSSTTQTGPNLERGLGIPCFID